jgi:hypothetical protein
MARIHPDFEWSHVLPGGKIVTNLTATREELLQVLRDVKADAAERLADAHHRIIRARRLWAEREHQQVAGHATDGRTGRLARPAVDPRRRRPLRLAVVRGTQCSSGSATSQLNDEVC